MYSHHNILICPGESLFSGQQRNANDYDCKYNLEFLPGL